VRAVNGESVRSVYRTEYENSAATAFLLNRTVMVPRRSIPFADAGKTNEHPSSAPG
jgi:hypothetical protein